VKVLKLLLLAGFVLSLGLSSTAMASIAFVPTPPIQLIAGGTIQSPNTLTFSYNSGTNTGDLTVPVSTLLSESLSSISGIPATTSNIGFTPGTTLSFGGVSFTGVTPSTLIPSAPTTGLVTFTTSSGNFSFDSSGVSTWAPTSGTIPFTSADTAWQTFGQLTGTGYAPTQAVFALFFYGGTSSFATGLGSGGTGLAWVLIGAQPSVPEPGALAVWSLFGAAAMAFRVRRGARDRS